jgi:parvulin-like peptidyl-prolyl isomerase
MSRSHLIPPAAAGTWSVVAAAALALSSLTLSLLGGCHRAPPATTPPPDARRPVIKTEAELAAEREQRIRGAQVVPTTAPTVAGEALPARRPSKPPPPPLQPVPGAVQADILMVNDTALTVAEVLYPLRDRIDEVRKTQTAAGFRERVRQMVREETQRAVGGILIYAEAMSKLDENQRKNLDKAIDKEIAELAAREYDGSAARLTATVQERGMTMPQFRLAVQRDLIVRQYTREKLLPLIQIRRDELLDAYRRNTATYQTPETREFLIIELPFAAFLPAGQTWAGATPTDRAAAKLAAVQAAREAHAALADRPFADVAREYSREVHGAAGGSWGPIAKPLQPPYDEPSKAIFTLAEGQFSDPAEVATGWYIVGCGKIEPAQQRSFQDVQDQLRRELMERRFQKLSVEYVLKLAENATVSSLEPFILAAVSKAERTGT